MTKGASLRHARHRSHRAATPLHFRRHGDADFDLRRESLARDADRIFPNIGIPVVSVVWTYNGLPPDDMSGRVIYYYERTLTAQVNDIEHIESQSLPGYGIVKIYFQPKVKIDFAIAQVTAASQTVSNICPAGITPPYVLSYNASSVPVLQLALSSANLSQAQLFDYAQNFIRPQPRDRRRRRRAFALWRQGASGADRHRPRKAAQIRPFGAGCRRRPGRAKSDHAGRHAEDRRIRIYRRSSTSRRRRSPNSTTCR